MLSLDEFGKRSYTFKRIGSVRAGQDLGVSIFFIEDVHELFIAQGRSDMKQPYIVSILF